MQKYYIFILVFFINTIAFSDSEVLLNKLINTNECIECDFSNIELKGANFLRANLSQSDFTKTNLTKSTLQGANLSGVNFTETVLIVGQCRLQI